MYAFDVAYEMTRQPVARLLGQPVEQFVVDASKRNPRQLSFYRPQMVRLPPVDRLGPHGPVRVERTIKLLPVGAISITVRLPFTQASLEELVAYHDLTFDGRSLHDEVRQLAEDVRHELASFFIRPHPRLVEEEAYTVFCLEAPPGSPSGTSPRTEDWLQSHLHQIAALLTNESNIGRLSKQEAEESTGRFLSYYEHDLLVIDWDAALLIDEQRNFEEALYVMELANFQLAELEAYDRLLDDAVVRSYRDLRLRPLRSRREVLHELREIRIDLACFNDELSNITKFFGDWHLARIYQNISTRFHLEDWYRSIGQKLKTLDDLYQLLSKDRMDRWMLVLEATIVLLFVIDLIILLIPLLR